MRSVSHVSRVCILVLVGGLPLWTIGCAHRAGCRGCGAGSSQPASFDPSMTRAGGPPGPAPASTAGTIAKRQTTCPVTGEKLGSMGRPIPVSVKGETIYVCCQDCVGAVQAEPDKYLGIVRSQGAGPGSSTATPTDVTLRERQLVDPRHGSGTADHSH